MYKQTVICLQSKKFLSTQWLVVALLLPCSVHRFDQPSIHNEKQVYAGCSIRLAIEVLSKTKINKLYLNTVLFAACLRICTQLHFVSHTQTNVVLTRHFVWHLTVYLTTQNAYQIINSHSISSRNFAAYIALYLPLELVLTSKATRKRTKTATKREQTKQTNCK